MSFRARFSLILALCLGTFALKASVLAVHALEPSPAGSVIGQLVAHLLEQVHYDHHAITQKDSKQFLRNYIESYDYSHMVFTKADVDDFEAVYGASLGDQVKAGNVSAAYAIFDRFLARLRERNKLLHELTASTFTFTANESLSIDWQKAPWPATPEETRDLWRRSVKYELLRARLDGQKAEEQIKTVNSHYDNLLDSYKQFDAGDVLQDFLAVLCHVFDPHSDYLAPPLEDNFKIRMRLGLVGIGVALRAESGYTRVLSLIPGGPADVDKRLKPGDKIEAVAQGEEPFVDIVGMKIDSVVQLIRGSKGSLVRLRVIPADASDPMTRVIIRLVRDEIHLKDQEAKARLITTHAPGKVARKFGVIRLPSFYADMQTGAAGKSTTHDIQTLLSALRRKGIQGLVLDLRDNGGGALNEAIELVGLFLGQGPVVQVKNSRGNVEVLDSEGDGDLYPDPVVVLTSRASASASEIVAAALQDYGRAVIIGDASTFGKGTVQKVFELSPFMPRALRDIKPGSVHLTIQKFYRVCGESTQNRGVIPDIKLPAIEDYMDMAESALPRALPYDEIAPAAYWSMPTVSRLLPSIKAASAARVASSVEFSYLREDIENYRKRMKDKTVSLNEAELLAEKKADEERETRRKKERQARGIAKPDELEITLDALDGAVPSAPPTSSTATAKSGKADYEKSPPAPEVILDESLNVLSDMVGS